MGQFHPPWSGNRDFPAIQLSDFQVSNILGTQASHCGRKRKLKARLRAATCEASSNGYASPHTPAKASAATCSQLSKANGLGNGRRIPLSDISAQDTDVQLRGDRHVNPDVDGPVLVCVPISRPLNGGELVIAERREARPILGGDPAEGLESVVSYRWDNANTTPTMIFIASLPLYMNLSHEDASHVIVPSLS
jgi:hypothetical protein